MAKKTSTKQTSTKKAIAAFGEKVADLKARGFEPLIPTAGIGEGQASIAPASPIETIGTIKTIASISPSPPRVAQLTNDTDVPYIAADDMHVGGQRMAAGFSFFAGKQSQPQYAGVTNIGTKGLGYIPWGPKDNLPNQIFNYANALPYTSAALKYITDLTVALGPQLTYQYARYVNGSVKEERIPYEHAGLLLRHRMQEVRDKIAARDAAQGGAGEEPSTPPIEPIVPIGPIAPINNIGTISSMTPVQKDSHTILLTEARPRPIGGEPIAAPKDSPLPGSLEEELAQLESDYAAWQRTMPEYKRFIEDNNLQLHYLKCMTDDTHMDIYFPTYGLSVGRAGEWRPKIVAVGHIPAVCARMEQMDKNWHVNHVFYSEKWRQDATPELETKDVVAYPSLSPDATLKELRAVVERNRKTGVKRRPLWFCAPTVYPSMLKPYYPQPAWWSIFPSQIYNYASTLVLDKAIARQNATMWGKIIFINLSYLKQIYDQMGADTPEKQEAIKTQIYADVNNFLKKRENNGKTLFLDSFLTNNDQMLWKSIEIVDVPQASAGAQTKEELEEISSILFFAMGVHPALIGAVPGKSGSSGGTFQRELHLLKQQQVSPRQRIYLKYLQNIVDFNEWDPHAHWIIREQVLTTLDRNASGLEETASTT